MEEEKSINSLESKKESVQSSIGTSKTTYISLLFSLGLAISVASVGLFLYQRIERLKVEIIKKIDNQATIVNSMKNQRPIVNMDENLYLKAKNYEVLKYIYTLEAILPEGEGIKPLLTKLTAMDEEFKPDMLNIANDRELLKEIKLIFDQAFNQQKLFELSNLLSIETSTSKEQKLLAKDELSKIEMLIKYKDYQAASEIFKNAEIDSEESSKVQIKLEQKAKLVKEVNNLKLRYLSGD